MADQPRSCAIGTCAIGIIANPADCFMQNKPNFLLPKMNATLLLTEAYANENDLTLQQNKPNQTKFRRPDPSASLHCAQDDRRWLRCAQDDGREVAGSVGIW
jgi:hypothetical protein